MNLSILTDKHLTIQDKHGIILVDQETRQTKGERDMKNQKSANIIERTECKSGVVLYELLSSDGVTQ